VDLALLSAGKLELEKGMGMNNWLNLEGNVCAVTGALGGRGVEICREFARNGADVGLLDLDEDKVKTAAAGLSDEFGIPMTSAFAMSTRF